MEVRKGEGFGFETESEDEEDQSGLASLVGDFSLSWLEGLISFRSVPSDLQSISTCIGR